MSKQVYNQDEVPLTGILSEFRTALREEIEAARRNESSSAVSLINGRRIAQVGGNYQYLFDLENVLNAPGDMPGDLYVEGRTPLNVMIISIVGMAITLNVPEDLGKVVPSARFRSNLAYLMSKLIERIEVLANKSNSVGERVLGLLPASGELASIPQLEKLNSSQAEAVKSALGRNITFIWGPPGTGKTQTIGSISEQLYRKGRSVLLVSHTNIAVEQAILRIGELLSPDDLSKGYVLRVGEYKDKDPRFDKYPDLLLKTHVERKSEELTKRRDVLKTELNTKIEEVKDISRKIDICEWLDEAKADIPIMNQELESIQKLEQELNEKKNEQLQLSKESAKWDADTKAAQHTKNLLDEIIKLDELIVQINSHIKTTKDKIIEIEEKLSQVKVLYEEIISINWLTRQWRRLPSPESQLDVIQKLQTEIEKISVELEDAQHNLTQNENKRATFNNEVESFYSNYSSAPEDILYKASVYNEKLIQTKSQMEQLTKTCYKKRLQLEELLTARLSVLKEHGLTQGITHESLESAELMILDIKTAYENGISQTEGLEVADLRKCYIDLNKHISAIEIEIQHIEESLKKVEEVVISQAKIIATTLTRAYLRDSIQARRFDTVILDEASMAPIPALWAVAGLADINAVVVGDPKQLPPIVISQHPLAKEWLGKDIFEKNNFNYDTQKSHLIKLEFQYRMHPKISDISNKLIYLFLQNGRINKDGIEYDLSDKECDKDLLKWYNSDWGCDTPVLLVNTASVGAWVTSVSRGMKSSRLNFLSATICIDIARKLLRNEREEWKEEMGSRILIACPYHPHARLLEILLNEENLKGEVRAGTAHNFQGTEADVVILDLVNDEPHWRIGMFDSKRDDNTKRLLNVALTRARRRLIIVGDFEYILKLSKKAFIGAELIPFLQKHYVCVDALNVVPAGLSARASKAQTSIYGGDIEPDISRLVITQEHFYPMLRGDLKRAQKRIVIYSAFMTSERLSQLEISIKAAVEQGVQVYVVTKARDDRSSRELPTYRMLEETLNNWGVIVVHKRHMHEKLIFIDDNILWMGSLNPLSFSNTQEIMERRASQKVVDDFVKTLRLDDLIGEYKNGVPTCPICGSEMVASEGTDDPFYWRCVQDECYSRNIDQPPLKGDTITCANCGENVEYGEWGGEPHWRCIKDRKHRQKIARTHLRLPKMRALIPKQDLSKLDKLFNITTSTTQANLFK